jgi:hypothetical protein
VRCAPVTGPSGVATSARLRLTAGGDTGIDRGGDDSNGERIAGLSPRVRSVGTVGAARVSGRGRARPRRLRLAGSARCTFGASEWSEVRLTPSPHPCHHGHPVRARQLTRPRWHLGDHAGGDVGGDRATTASGQGACSRHARGSLGGEGLFRPEPPPVRGPWSELRLRARRPDRRPVRSLRWERERPLVATPATGRRDPAAAFGGSFGGRSGRWRHRPGSRRLRCRSVIARSSRRCGRDGAPHVEASAPARGSEPGPVHDGHAEDLLASAGGAEARRRVNLVATRRHRGGGEASGRVSRARISAPRGGAKSLVIHFGLSRRPHVSRPSGRGATDLGKTDDTGPSPPPGGWRPASRAKVVHHRSRLAAGTPACDVETRLHRADRPAPN